MKFYAGLMCAAVLLAVSVSAQAEAYHENKLFMKEYATYAVGLLDREPEVRAAIRENIEANRELLKNGFGKHPEIIFNLERMAGLDRVNCISGKYYARFEEELSNEERHAFYDTAHGLTWWIMQIAAEEADRSGIYKPSPPLTFRLRDDVPAYIAEGIRMELRGYLLNDLTTEDRKGLSFKALPCE
jgi:hypothetical protein